MPIIIGSGIVLGEPAGVLPLDHPRIMYDDIVNAATLTPSTEETGFEAVNIADYLTWDFWKPTALPATLEIESLAAADVDYALIAAHNLGTVGASISIDYWDGAAWVEIVSEVSPGNDSVLAFLFTSVTSNKFRLNVSGGATMPSVGVFMLGTALAVERKLYKQHTPITLGRRTLIRPQSSEAGQWLGRSIQRDGVATTITFNNLTSAWVRASLDPFIVAARTRAFGWAWRPADYPAEVAYCQAVGDINPVNSGPRDFMSVSFKVEGLVD